MCLPIAPTLQSIFADEAISLEAHTVPPIIVFGGRSLRFIRLRHNPLYRIEGPIFFTEPPEQLVIDLSDNMITCFAPGVFGLATNNGSVVAELNFSGNRLGEQLSTDYKGLTFSHLSSLVNLNLAWNTIKSLPPDVFTNVTRLEILNLSSNSLKLLEFRFDHMRNLRMLDLSNNLISSLSGSLQKKLSEMMTTKNLKINLNGNPLQCSCVTLEFIHWLKDYKDYIVNFGDYSCFYENKYHNFSELERPILRDLDFQCSKKVAMIVAGALLGLTLILVAGSAACYRHRWEIRYVCFRLTQRGQRYQQIVNNRVCCTDKHNTNIIAQCNLSITCHSIIVHPANRSTLRLPV